MAKLHLMTKTDKETVYVFECPGCGCGHWVRTHGPAPVWSWNGDMDKPTFKPSLLVSPHTDYQCHSYVTDGKIRFLPDSYHALAGKTVEIPEW